MNAFPNSNLIYGCEIWVQEHSTEFEKIEKQREKAIRIIKLLPIYASIIKNEKIKNCKIKKLCYTLKHSLRKIYRQIRE